MVLKLLLFAASSLLFDCPHLPWFADNDKHHPITQIDAGEVPILASKGNEVFFLCPYALVPEVSVSYPKGCVTIKKKRKDGFVFEVETFTRGDSIKWKASGFLPEEPEVNVKAFAIYVDCPIGWPTPAPPKRTQASP